MSDEEEVQEIKDRQAREDIKDRELAEYLSSIGAKSLAAELRELRYVNRITEARRWLDFHDARLSYEEQLHDKLDQRLMSNQSILFDKSQAYMNFVVTLGYAGFFGIWNLVKGFMHPWDMKLVAILLGVSLLVFIAWTLIAMVAGSSSVSRVAKALRENPDGRDAMLEAVEAAEKENLKRGLILQRFWMPTFLISIATGFLAGILLLVLLMFDVVGHRFSLHELFFNP